jgi:16S rRNA (guanine527-N7)-methyltransferase
MKALLSDGAKELGIDLTALQLDQFSAFLRLLQEWNTRMNLTAITGERDIIIKHFLNALTLLPLVSLSGKKVIDVGTGAGMPGIPLAIACPDATFTLMDSLQKRIGFLEIVKEKLGLGNVHLVHARAEELGQDPKHREQYDVAIARSVASMPILAEYCLPLVRVGGTWAAYKAHDVQEESSNALTALGGTHSSRDAVTIPESAITHDIITIQKTAATPATYPRRPGAPKKKPL